jgi:hypothetical protein
VKLGEDRFERGADGRRLVEVHNRDRLRDESRRSDDDPERLAVELEPPGQTEQDVQRRAVEEQDSVEVEHEPGRSGRELFQATLEVVRIRQVKLACELDECRLAEICLAHLELVRGHAGRIRTIGDGPVPSRLGALRFGHETGVESAVPLPALGILISSVLTFQKESVAAASSA